MLRAELCSCLFPCTHTRSLAVGDHGAHVRNGCDSVWRQAEVRVGTMPHQYPTRPPNGAAAGQTQGTAVGSRSLEPLGRRALEPLRLRLLQRLALGLGKLPAVLCRCHAPLALLALALHPRQPLRLERGLPPVEVSIRFRQDLRTRHHDALGAAYLARVAPRAEADAARARERRLARAPPQREEEAALLVPVRLDVVEPIVTEERVVNLADHAHRHAVLLRVDEGEVAPPLALRADLPLAAEPIVAALARVLERVAAVDIVLVAAARHNRLRDVLGAALPKRDAANGELVQADAQQRDAIRELHPDLDALGVAPRERLLVALPLALVDARARLLHLAVGDVVGPIDLHPAPRHLFTRGLRVERLAVVLDIARLARLRTLDLRRAAHV
mmetsp:Transcript_70248/g.211237  ORF Transcript_70248/g.211237 Transcript_70248/m.211237 type:complete len:387 (+) Transcript_70248:202-1362(+)